MHRSVELKACSLDSSNYDGLDEGDDRLNSAS